MLRVGEDIWPEVQEEMTRSLATMRVDYDQVHIKDLNNSNNELLNKRRKRGDTPVGSAQKGHAAEQEVQ